MSCGRDSAQCPARAPVIFSTFFPHRSRTRTKELCFTSRLARLPAGGNDDLRTGMLGPTLSNFRGLSHGFWQPMTSVFSPEIGCEKCSSTVEFVGALAVGE